MIRKQKIVVIGAGIVGASMAYNLSKRNQDVTVIECNSTAACEVTGKSFAWINSSGRVSKKFRHLYDATLAEYHSLEKDLPDLKVNWNGALTWGVPTNVEKSHIQKLNRKQIIELEPNLKEYPEEAGFAYGEGAVDPVLTTKLLLKKAEENGANILFDTKVTQIKKESSNVVGVYTSIGFIESDIIVLATGANLPELCKPLGFDVPVAPSPSIIIRMKSKEKLIHTLISNSKFEARQLTNDIIIAAEDYIDESEENGPETIGKRAFETLRHHLNGGENLELESIKVGWRPMPEDGYPIVGFHEQIGGLYLSVMHSAITLAPIVSRLAANEIIDDVKMNELECCRLSRFIVEDMTSVPLKSDLDE
ncbi:FAD-binding oxidoreductase [Paenibacillus sp. HWE-109]|uniref:NAD(P)/FAD-dependent oxidoreductase n=1 Tax=Paenibacillus sp. HWE-109 TaxID=1306526 RepID=UPI001EDDAAF0|nr:FAD-dependent oxidoreductase [Paenibacillus sp. HWE-109]UKS26886.1 FAD-binding oxidoreductase [Paenibacillus sp. HWE-109]